MLFLESLKHATYQTPYIVQDKNVTFFSWNKRRFNLYYTCTWPQSWCALL